MFFFTFFCRSPSTVSDDNASRDSVGSNSGGRFRSGSALPVPGTGSAPPTPEPQNLDYSDIIRYYNRVFVSRVEYFLKRLQPGLVDLNEVYFSYFVKSFMRHFFDYCSCCLTDYNRNDSALTAHLQKQYYVEINV